MHRALAISALIQFKPIAMVGRTNELLAGIHMIPFHRQIIVSCYPYMDEKQRAQVINVGLEPGAIIRDQPSYMRCVTADLGNWFYRDNDITSSSILYQLQTYARTQVIDTNLAGKIGPTLLAAISLNRFDIFSKANCELCMEEYVKRDYDDAWLNSIFGPTTAQRIVTRCIMEAKTICESFIAPQDISQMKITGNIYQHIMPTLELPLRQAYYYQCSTDEIKTNALTLTHTSRYKYYVSTHAILRYRIIHCCGPHVAAFILLGFNPYLIDTT